MLTIESTSAFKKDLKKRKHDHRLIEDLNEVIIALSPKKPLPTKNRAHNLTGNWIDHKECYLRGDALLIYRTNKTSLILVRLGSHSELFKI